MSFPAMNPMSVIYIPGNAQVNLGMAPAFCPVQPCTITGVSLTSATAVNVADAASDIFLNLVQLANATNVIATLSLNSTSNLIANTPCQLAINATTCQIAAGVVCGWNVLIENVANKSFGTIACYQIDYVQGSPASEA